MTLSLRYASHLGYRSAQTPLFLQSVGSLDPEAHIDFAADRGLVAVQYALAVTRSIEEQTKVGRALTRRGLVAGCILFAPIDVVRSALWTRVGSEGRVWIRKYLVTAIDVARRVGSRHIAVLSGVSRDAPLVQQAANMVENLEWASDLAADAGMTLCLESVATSSLNNMLLHHIRLAQEIVRRVDSPAVKLIFDTAHVHAMDGDVLANLDACLDDIAIVQIADSPGRLEPGSAEIAFAPTLRALRSRNFAGLVELEHGWSRPTAVPTRGTRLIVWCLFASESRPLAHAQRLAAASVYFSRCARCEAIICRCCVRVSCAVFPATPSRLASTPIGSPPSRTRRAQRNS